VAMKPCIARDRHGLGPEPPSSRSGGTLASIVLSLSLAAAAGCGPRVELDTLDGSSTAADDDTSPPSPPLTTTGVTTTDVTTVGPTPGDGTSTTNGEPEPGSSSSEDDSSCLFADCGTDHERGPECDTFEQNCPEGEKCVPYGSTGGEWDDHRCVPVVPEPADVGEPCTVQGHETSGLDDCDLGLLCVFVDDVTGIGECVDLCDGVLENPLCREEGHVCSITNEGFLTLCLPACDPLLGDCPEGEGCFPTPNDVFVCATLTEDPGGGQGEPCEHINDCVPGHVCTGSAANPDCMGMYCCSAYCDVNAGLPCPGAELGVTCQPWFEPGAAPPGYEDVGVCALPS